MPSWIDEHAEQLRGKSILMYVRLDLWINLELD
jgi:hypothetical protein